ncbi:hypothetical protein [Anabaena sp. CCY 9910]|uniref:hypothetical protein n=1 Tax=Anabaena sp. CCY 9910 TaxID=3103870 RepID=UPI0039E1F61E
MLKKILYINFFLLFFPAFSLSYPFTGVYFQSRILGLPFLVLYFLLNIFNKKIIITKQIFIFLFPLKIAIIVPFLGLLANRKFSLIDIGYMTSFLYLILFTLVVKKEKVLFVKFTKIFTVANIVYSIWQVFLMNLGLAQFAMIHCNLPSKSDYTIPVGILPSIYRFSGLFNESSPLLFYLCSSYIFLCEINKNKLEKDVKIIQYATLFMIIISGSKLSFAFLSLLFISKLLSLIKDRGYRNLLNISLIAIGLFFLTTNYSEIIDILSQNLTAFKPRYESIHNSTTSLLQIEILGNGFLPSSTGEAGGLDAITIIIGGYGVLFGFTIILTFLVWILVETNFNFIFVAVYILGLVSNGSLLVSQYTLLFAMIYVLGKPSLYKISDFLKYTAKTSN